MTITAPTTATPVKPQFELDEDFDSLTMDACEILSQTDCVFSVSGFGQDRWPVDVSYDLSSVIEQLPDALLALQRGEPTQIDLYGQGVERTVSFVPGQEKTVVKCTSNTAWAPEPDAEEVLPEEPENLLVTLARDFKAALQQACPDVAAVAPFANW